MISNNFATMQWVMELKKEPLSAKMVFEIHRLGLWNCAIWNPTFALDLFNHRQVELLRHALKHPYQQYLIESHKVSHNTSYETARTDLLDLSARGILRLIKRGRQMVFIVPKGLENKIRKLGVKR
jgi:hypothetical protein